MCERKIIKLVKSLHRKSPVISCTESNVRKNDEKKFLLEKKIPVFEMRKNLPQLKKISEALGGERSISTNLIKAQQVMTPAEFDTVLNLLKSRKEKIDPPNYPCDYLLAWNENRTKPLLFTQKIAVLVPQEYKGMEFFAVPKNCTSYTTPELVDSDKVWREGKIEKINQLLAKIKYDLYICSYCLNPSSLGTKEVTTTHMITCTEKKGRKKSPKMVKSINDLFDYHFYKKVKRAVTEE